MSAILLQTPRLMLRAFTAGDADNLYRLNNDSQVLRFAHVGTPPTLEQVRDEILPKYLSYHERFEHYGYWATVEKKSGQFIGWMHFRPSVDNQRLFRPGVDLQSDIELGYRLMQEFCGKGYATEAAVALVAKGIDELGLSRITASAMKGNIPSIRVMQKTGMKQIDEYIHEELRLHMVQYAIERKDFYAGKTHAER